MRARAFVVRGWPTIAAALALIASLGQSANAQVVHGAVGDSTGRRLSGVVVLLVDSTQRPTTRALTDDAGRFRLAAPSPGTYRLRTLRIGYKPSTSSPVTLEATSTVERQIVLVALPLNLDTVRVGERTACSSIPADSAATIATVWEQARTALTAARLTAGGRAMAATTLSFQRVLDPSSGQIRAQSTAVRTEYVREPWKALAPDSLRRLGYVVLDKNGTATFYAPGFDMLLDPAFVEDHCFRLGKKSDARLIVLEFEPTRDRRRIAEIAGALTLDRRTAELRRLEFKYVNVEADLAEYARGQIDYARLGNGGWVISRWTIQMPVIERGAPGGGSFLGQRVTQPDTRVSELQVTGGVVTAVVANRDTVWIRPPITVAGRVTDSTSGAPVPGARVGLSGTSTTATTDEGGRFTIDALPGSYTAEVRTAGLDSVGAVHTTPIVVTDSTTPIEIKTPTAADLRVKLCGAGHLDQPGVVVGRVTLPMRDGTRVVRVTAVWQALSLEEPAPGRIAIAQGRRSVEARANADGTFRLCGVPVETDLRIYVTSVGSETPSPTIVRIKAPGRFASVDLALEAIGQGTAVYTGIVLADSTEQPVAEAQVAFSDLARVVTTDALGAFRLDSIPPGEHQLVVRRLGFAPVTTTVVLRPGERRKQTILLARSITLDSVRIVATELDRAMISFEDHRRAGLGSFLTRAELATQETLTAAAVLQTLRGLHLAHGRGGIAWVVSGRGTQSLMATSLRQGDRNDRAAGAPPACYALVYLDGRVAYGGRENEPLFNVNSIRPSDLEAAEFYAGPAEAPGKYANLNSTCGILVLWSRRP
jgi:hypothetical protein